MAKKTKEPQVKQTVGDNIENVTGDVIFGKITQIGYQTIIHDKASFFEPDLKAFKKSNFPSPKMANEAIRVFLQNHLLVLADGSNIDKSSLARHLVTLLAEELSKNSQKAVVVKEWHRTANPSSIEAELEDSDIFKILILTQVNTQNLSGYTLSDIQKLAFKKDHFIITTTDIPKDAWYLADPKVQWWHDLSNKDIEGCEILINELSDQESLNNWYYNKLDEREQLLAIGLSLFDGLFDDQFFAAFEMIVERTWKNRNPNLKALDYCDLDKLKSYFNFIDADKSHTLVKIRSPKQRFICLKIAWKSHRRQILSALSVLVDIAKDSVQSPTSELYGSKIRRDQIRQSVSEAISNVGLISRLGSREAVEDSLLALAASTDIEVQAVAAQSIASWRDPENQEPIVSDLQKVDIDEELFSILERWQTETQIYRFLSLLLRDRDNDNPSDYIRSTLAITIAYSALYDAPSNLHKKLFLLFKDLSQDKNELVTNSFKRYTIPFFVNRHLAQISDFLTTMVKDHDLIPSVSESLALALKHDSHTVTNLLDEWQLSCKSKYKKLANSNQLGQRECLLITVSLTYAQIFHLEIFKFLDQEKTINDYFDKFINILKFEQHDIVRSVLIESIGALIKYDFLAMKRQIQKLLQFLNYGQETDKLVTILSDIYLKQREALPTGDDIVVIDERDYPIWFDYSLRPTSLIEDTLLEWIATAQVKRLQELAAECLMTFVRKFEEEESKKIESLKSKPKRFHLWEEEISSNPFQVTPPLENRYITKFIPWLATFKSPDFLPSVSHLLPKAVVKNTVSPSSIKFLLKKLDNASNLQLSNLSKLLSRGLWLSQYFLIAFLFGFGLFSWVLYFLNDDSYKTTISTSYSDSLPQQTPPPLPNPSPIPPNPFMQARFPLPTCGDPLPSQLSDYPIRFYPVYVAYSAPNLDLLQRDFCSDAYSMRRENTNERAIQVASFRSRQTAQDFQDFLNQYFVGQVEVGEPNTFKEPPER